MIEEPKLDFQVIETGDPKLLIVQDFSSWTTAENRVSTIEIEISNTEQTRVKFYQKNSYNGFNTSNLNLSDFGEYKNLPDGVYTITVKGSPSNLYSIEKKYLKTDKTELELAKLYLTLDIHQISDKNVKRTQHIRFIIEAAKSLMRDGQFVKAAEALKRAKEDIDRQNNCKDCD